MPDLTTAERAQIDGWHAQARHELDEGIATARAAILGDSDDALIAAGLVVGMRQADVNLDEALSMLAIAVIRLVRGDQAAPSEGRDEAATDGLPPPGRTCCGVPGCMGGCNFWAPTEAGP